MSQTTSEPPAAPSQTTPEPPAAPPPVTKPRPTLSKRQKAAIIVRVLLKEGVELQLDELPAAMQLDLTHEMGAIQSVDRETLDSIVKEFVDDVNALGMAFPGGLEGALESLDGALSPENLRRLRRETGLVVKGDPWETITARAPEDLVAILERESPEIAAIILSKLPAKAAAQLLDAVPDEASRKIAFAMSATATTDPDTVRTIGHAIAAQIADETPRAFEAAPEDRIGAILNSSRPETRDGVLDALTGQDAELGARVRKTIFTFADIPRRVETRDIPKIARAVDQATLVVALGSAEESDAGADGFILDNLTKRLAGQLRDDIEDLDPVKPAEAEEAKAKVIAVIRDLEQAGELTLLEEEDA